MLASETSKRRTYKSPPISQAICEIRFDPAAEWDLIKLAAFYEKVRPEYSSKPEQQVAFGSAQQQGSEPTISLQADSRLVIANGDKTRFISIAPNIVTIGERPPYGGWEEYRPRILQALDHWNSTLATPTAVRIGLRYINNIVVPEKSFIIGDYLQSGPMEPVGRYALTTFSHRDEYVLAKDSASRLIVGIQSGAATKESYTFTLDIDAIRFATEPVIRASDLPSIVDALKQTVSNAFESMITDKTRGLFDASG